MGSGAAFGAYLAFFFCADLHIFRASGGLLLTAKMNDDESCLDFLVLLLRCLLRVDGAGRDA